MIKLVKRKDQPNNEPISDDLYRLEEDYTFELFKDNCLYRITILKGFTYDGASVPRIFWTLSGLRPDGLIRAAALIHDLFYVYKGVLDESCKYVKVYSIVNGEEKESSIKLTRRESDILLSQDMLNFNMTKLQASTAFIAVQAWGWTKWRKERSYE